MADSVIFYSDKEGLKHHYSEVNCYGLYFNTVVFNEIDGGKNTYSLDSISLNLLTNIYIGTSILDSLDYYGNIILSYSLKNLRNKIISSDNALNSILPNQEKVELSSKIDNKFEFEEPLNFIIMKNERQQIFVKIIDEIIFALNGGVKYGGKNLGNKIYEVVNKIAWT